MRSVAICFFIILFVCVSAMGQHQQTVFPRPFPGYAFPNQSPFIMADSVVIKDLQAKPISLQRADVKVIPASLYATQVGFFCKKELQLEKATGLPVKFRLGSVAYTDQVEGKGQGLRQVNNHN